MEFKVNDKLYTVDSVTIDGQELTLPEAVVIESIELIRALKAQASLSTATVTERAICIGAYYLQYLRDGHYQPGEAMRLLERMDRSAGNLASLLMVSAAVQVHVMKHHADVSMQDVVWQFYHEECEKLRGILNQNQHLN